MDQAQRELEAEGVDVQIIGVNEVGFESGNDTITNGVDLPWLQDTMEVDCWTSWDVTYRDVVIVDREGFRQHTFNVTDHNLSDPDTYEAFKTVLRDVASR